MITIFCQSVGEALEWLRQRDRHIGDDVLFLRPSKTRDLPIAAWIDGDDWLTTGRLHTRGSIRRGILPKTGMREAFTQLYKSVRREDAKSKIKKRRQNSGSGSRNLGAARNKKNS